MATGKPGGRAALAWCLACIAAGIAIAYAYPGAYIQDPALHFLRARWMWSHPWMLVDVWDRPLFTLAYSLPAALPPAGIAYAAAKLCTVAVTVVAAWLTWDLAAEYQLGRPALVIPLMWLQPCVFLLSAETTPEPLFAMMFALALLLYRRGRLAPSAIVVSMLILVRPEGIALAVLWALCTIRDPRAGETLGKRAAVTSALLVGPAVWWYLSAQITTDWLFIVHNWPSLSASLGASLFGGKAESPLRQWAQIAGVVLALPFAVGLVASLWGRRLGMPVAAVATLLVAHIALGGTGVFGWAPVPAAFVCVAPAIALITLDGWNVLAAGASSWIPVGARRGVGLGVTAAVMVISLVGDLLVVDAQQPGRDWHPVAEMGKWFAGHPQPVTRMVWSEAYAGVQFGRDPDESALTYGDRAKDVVFLTAAPHGTVVAWDSDIGPSWYGLTGAQIEQIGYTVLQHQTYSEMGRLPSWVEAVPGVGRLQTLLRLDRSVAPRLQELWLLYRP
jgi:hypothetical protein